MQKFLTVKKEQESTLIINYSKFICSVKYVEREDDAREYISLVKKRHVLASSFAYAYISDLYGNNIKFNDGGEPQGTAGMPILNVLKNKKLCRICAVVTRYFGGVKLGAGGLVRAFSNVTADCISKSDICEIKTALNFDISCDYDIFSKLSRYMELRKYLSYDISYDREVSFRIIVEELQPDYAQVVINDLTNFCNGKIKIVRNKDSLRVF